MVVLGGMLFLMSEVPVYPAKQDVNLRIVGARCAPEPRSLSVSLTRSARERERECARERDRERDRERETEGERERDTHHSPTLCLSTSRSETFPSSQCG